MSFICVNPLLRRPQKVPQLSSWFWHIRTTPPPFHAGFFRVKLNPRVSLIALFCYIHKHYTSCLVVVGWLQSTRQQQPFTEVEQLAKLCIPSFVNTFVKDKIGWLLADYHPIFLKMYHFMFHSMSSLVTWDVVILVLIILKTHF